MNARSAILATLLLATYFSGLTDSQYVFAQTAATRISEGEQLFLANCAECHQADGQGIPSIYPALAGNETVLGSAVDVALVLRIGRGEMPSFRDSLSTADMATIINYIRNNWGNSGELINAADLESIR